MKQVADWLEKLGMSEYVERFAENDVDFTLLPELTDQDLEKIGIASLGHRRKILRAIAALYSTPTAAKPTVPVPEAVAPTPKPPAEGAPRIAAASALGERRYLTVMFCDLVGSTTISAQLDPEEWRDLVAAYLDAASAAVTEMGGHVAKKLGDGLLCLFGYPLAHENDAERSARAALSIQRALAELNRKTAGTGRPELVARIGLESGPAVLDASGEIYGDVANIAARVQALAEPGAVLVTARVQRQVAGLFVAEERGIHVLKGVPEPTALFRLVRASGGGRRSGPRNLTPLVGRDEELAMLMRRWERARQGDGQLVLIVGEPGLGKSRLIEEFHLRLKETPHTWTEWTCSQLLQNTPLHPIAEWGRQRFGGVDTPAELRLADLESSLAQVRLDPLETASLLAPLLDVPLPKEPVSTLAPEELRRRQLAAMTNWVMAGAKVQPVVLAFEDLHWADPTTLDLLRSIAERGSQVPLYIVATARPEFRLPWGMRSHHTTISLAPLDRGQVRDMVGELSASHALSREMIDDVAARTGGVPLFVEEVTRLLLERGEHGGAQTIPPTLQQSLMARLDRLGPAREVAQIGSVVGRGFSYGLLKTVAEMDDAPLQAALEKLSDADIVLVEGVLPDSNYRFKHALIQDAAYENLLKSRRQALHRRIAEVLRDRFAERVAAEPEVLAHHFTQAGLTDAAIEWWGKAGDQALRRSAFQEAISHLGKAIEMADKESDAAPRAAPAAPSQRLKLQARYGQALAWSRGFAAEETKIAFTRAQQLASGATDAEDRFAPYYGLWLGSFTRAELHDARDIAETFLHDADSAGRLAEAAVARRLLAITCFTQADFMGAQRHAEEALKIYDPARDHDIKSRFGIDTAFGASIYLALITWVLGGVTRARALSDEAEALATISAHVPSLANAHAYKMMLEILRGDARSALVIAERLVDLSREHGISIFLDWGLCSVTWAKARLGDQTVSVDECRRVLTEHNVAAWAPFYQGLLAELEAENQGTKEEALARVDAAIASAAKTGAYWSDAILHRIRGDILLKLDPASTSPAEEAFLAAIAIAQKQKARSLELPAALSLAKLYHSMGRAPEAHTVLAPALEGFSPTSEFVAITEAQALLAALVKTNEVKNAVAARQRRLKLQTRYAQATMLSRGFGSEESKTAFTHAGELAAQTDADERFDAYYGLWVASLLRGELQSARERAEAFLREANSEGRITEAAVAYRNVGLTCLFQGDFAAAQANLKEVLRLHDPERDRDAKFRFAADSAINATIYLGWLEWQFGNFVQGRDLVEQAVKRAVDLNHPSTLANVYTYKTLLEIVRGNAEDAKHAAEAAIRVSREYGTALYSAVGALSNAWARAWLGDRNTGITELRQELASYSGQGNKLRVPFYEALLAQLEAEGQDVAGALSRVEEALALAGATGEHWSDAVLYRIRGEILLNRDPANTLAAEELFLAAIAVAKQQKARSFELRAALSLAKLCQSTSRLAEAHAVLARALGGLSPTPECPQIVEAQTLLAALV